MTDPEPEKQWNVWDLRSGNRIASFDQPLEVTAWLSALAAEQGAGALDDLEVEEVPIAPDAEASQ